MTAKDCKEMWKRQKKFDRIATRMDRLKKYHEHVKDKETFGVLDKLILRSHEQLHRDAVQILEDDLKLFNRVVKEFVENES